MSDQPEINAGDTLILTQQDGFRTARVLVKVARLTKTRVVVLDGGKERAFQRGGFMKEVGRTGHHTPSLDIPRPGEIDEVNDENARVRLIAKINRAMERPAAISTARLRSIAIILNEAPS